MQRNNPGRRVSIFFRRGGRVCSRGDYQIIEVDLIRGGDGLILLPGSRDGRQLILLLMLSIKPSLGMQMLLSSRSHCMRVRGRNKVKHERTLEDLSRGSSLRGWARYNAGLHRTN